jgi:hypothetical protein
VHDVDVCSCHALPCRAADSVAFYLNSGGSGAAAFSGVQHAVARFVDGCVAVDVGDLDKDGDVDIVSVSSVTSEVFLHEVRHIRMHDSIRTWVFSPGGAD